ncbi:cysteine hydrolase family protein [Chitinophaga sp. Cy-1792]|uniref:cysteine hydrolase family protein n=1 Tax=Chitinophaga sp. Cy-1792 TaxID=2608339 RepID=UPI00141F7C7B|nr:cysteine hydrolase family protein [Chitinophaga sp. Cy-1792]NIG55778.1 cysteine hydrolase [Chitinophaga sp. Cy-1792]
MKTALLIIDVQNDYFEGGAHTLVNPMPAAMHAQQVLTAARLRQLPVVHIQHLAINEGADFFLPGTPGADIHPLVEPASGEMLVIKHYPNSFRETTLLEYLRGENITDLLICGMMTDVCIDATVRAAMDAGFTTTVIGDACTTRDRELYGKPVAAAAVHQAYLAGMAALGGLYAHVITAAEFCGNQ